MQLPRTYAAKEVREFLDILRTDDEISKEKIAGMEMLVRILDEFSNMNDADIANNVSCIFKTL